MKRRGVRGDPWSETAWEADQGHACVRSICEMWELHTEPCPITQVGNFLIVSHFSAISAETAVDVLVSVSH